MDSWSSEHVKWQMTADYELKNSAWSMYPFKDEPDSWVAYPRLWQLLHFRDGSGYFLPDLMLEGIDHSKSGRVGSSRKLLDILEWMKETLDSRKWHEGKEWFDGAVRFFSELHELVKDEVENHHGVLFYSPRFTGEKKLDDGEFLLAWESSSGKSLRGKEIDLDRLRRVISSTVMAMDQGHERNVVNFLKGNTCVVDRWFLEGIVQGDDSTEPRFINTASFLHSFHLVAGMMKKARELNCREMELFWKFHDVITSTVKDGGGLFLLVKKVNGPTGNRREIG
jgi:hypothetical protein